MTTDKLQGEFREVLASKVDVHILRDCLAAKLAGAARNEYGRNELAGKALGVCAITLSRWTVAGRMLPIDEQLQSTIGRIAQALFDVERLNPPAEAAPKGIADRIFEAFDAGMVHAAVENTQGNKVAAARLLGVHRNWISKYTKARREA
jgi:DNA-binding NtrC family response regulator